MFTRKSITSLGLVVALVSPAAALADFTWIRTNDEAGSAWVFTPDVATKRVTPVDTKALKLGDLSADRQYVFIGGDSDWELRQMEHRFESGRLVHVDDPAGHMHGIVDAGPLTAQERAMRANSSGS